MAALLDVRLQPAAAATDSTLASLHYGSDEAGLPLAPFAGPACEVWRTDGPVRRYQSHGYACADDGRTLFFRRLDSAAGDIEAAAESAYRDLLALGAATGYSAWLRLWNYFDRLTEGEGDDERYKRFCVGRHRALEAPGFEQRLPAATVIGTRTPGLHLYGIAARAPGRQIENPRQTSAFRYPREYGPRAPSFSRATLYGRQLLVSGTAAIVGHETLHPYDARAQAPEMLANLDALLVQAGGRWQARLLKLYVADGADAPAAEQAVRTRFGADAPLLVLHGEVCRRGLMIEIEGVFDAVE